MISKADKGNSIVILYLDKYIQKVEEFISNNNFTVANSDITKKLQKITRSTINKCQKLIHKNDRWKYINLNPMAPTLRGLGKLHKEDTPIRPVINRKNKPGYKMAKMLARKLTSYIPLPFTYNVTNTVQLISDLTDFPYDHNIKFASLDISIITSPPKT